MNNFWLRALTGTIFVALLAASVYVGGIFLYSVLGLFSILGLSEFYALFKETPYSPNQFAIVIGAIFMASLVLKTDVSAYIYLPLLFLTFPLLGIWELFRNKTTPFQNIALSILGIIYVIFPFMLLFLLGSNPENPTGSADNYAILLSVFVLVWCNDTFAYLTGRSLGKHKLFERISPKKTWEGFIGGILFAIAAAALLAFCFEFSYLKMIVYGLIVGIFGTAGDLVQSMLKRSVNVKDSGKLLPGHGGILDRFDGVIFVAPIIYYLETFVFATIP